MAYGRSRNPWLVLLPSVLAQAAACDSGGPLPFSDVRPRILAAVCKLYVACGELPDQASCTTSLQEEPGFYATLQQDIDAGKVLYDGNKARVCVDLYGGLNSCKQSEIGPIAARLVAACDGMFTGTISAGGACFFSEECAGGGGCALTDPACSRARQCCAGTCLARPTPIPVGGDCTAPMPNQGCAEGSFCPAFAPGQTAVCTVPSHVEGTACTGSSDCASPLFCDLDPATGTGTCRRAPPTGASCNPDASDACDDGRDLCDPVTSLCTPRVAVGAACDPTQNSCVRYATCVTTTCVARPQVGEACDPLNGPACLEGLMCDATTTKCALSPVGSGACL